MRCGTGIPWRGCFHLPANVAVFKDDGVRVFNSILVVAELGAHDLVLARTADLLADTTGGKIRFVATVPEGEATEGKTPSFDLANLCQSEAEVEVICTDEGIDHLEDLSADFDLLLLEEPPYEHFTRNFMRRMTDQLTERAPPFGAKNLNPRRACKSKRTMREVFTAKNYW